MSWLFPWRRRRQPPEKVRPDIRQAAPEPATETSGELFLDAEAAQRPIDLSGELEAGAPPPDRGRALQAEVEGLLAKSTGVAERALLTELRRGLRRGGLQLPPMPQVILRVHRLISSGDFNMQDVARQIELDPALATKMVGIANSPFYAGMEPAQSVRDSIVRIGMLETRNILMAIMMHSRVFRVPGFEELTQELWEHALAASVTTRSLAAQVGTDPELAFLAGLVHDVGRAVILSCAGDVRRHSRGQLQPDPLVLEGVMEFLHAQLGAIVTDSWHLGEDLATAIVHHHDPAGAPEPVRRFASLLAVGDELAKQLLRSREEGPPDEEILAARIALLGLPPELAGDIFAEASEEFEELGKVL